MLTDTTLQMTKELREILGKIRGVKSVQESFAIEYLVLVDSEEDKQNATQVTNKLLEQASSHGLDLSFIVVTSDELDNARKLLSEQKSNTFKFAGD